jgi:hypothetical protein
MSQNSLVFKKEDLSEIDYSWNKNLTDENKLNISEPSRRLFDRYNGNHILYMINYFADTVQRISLKEARTLERLLRDKLPLGVKSELSVFRWLVNCYTCFSAL